jgi:anti-anti-sigma factor
MLTIKEENPQGNVKTVSLCGFISMGEACIALHTWIKENLERLRGSVFLLDFSEVTYIDSMGLGLLTFLAKEASKRNGMVALVAKDKRILSFLRLTDFRKVMPIYKTRKEAVADLNAEKSVR